MKYRIKLNILIELFSFLIDNLTINTYIRALNYANLNQFSMSDFENVLRLIMKIGKNVQKIKSDKKKNNLSIVRECDYYIYNQFKVMMTQMDECFISQFDKPEYEERKNWKSFWILSSIIGKKSFRGNKADYLISITKVKNRRPNFAILFAPQMNEVFVAIDNKAYKIENINQYSSLNINELLTEKNQIYKPIESSFFTIMKNKSKMNAKTEKMLDYFKLHKSGTIQEKIDESPMNLIGIAEGKYDFHPHLKSIYEWDIAPFDAIISASGNRVTQKDGILPLEYNSKTLKFADFIAKNNFDIDSNDLKE